MAQVCQNIGPAQIAKRNLIGWTMLVFCISILLLFALLSVPSYFAGLLFFPLLVSMLGFFQAREKT